MFSSSCVMKPSDFTTILHLQKKHYFYLKCFPPSQKTASDEKEGGCFVVRTNVMNHHDCHVITIYNLVWLFWLFKMHYVCIYIIMCWHIIIIMNNVVYSILYTVHHLHTGHCKPNIVESPGCQVGDRHLRQPRPSLQRSHRGRSRFCPSAPGQN